MAKTTKSKAGTMKSTRRRDELRKMLPRPALDLRAVFQRPEFINATLALLAFLTITSVLAIWSREQPKVRDGQIMTTTRETRLDYQIEDEEATLAKREEARKAAPRVYRLNDSYLGRLEASLLGLPKAVAGKTALDEISPEIAREFALTEDELEALQHVLLDGEPAQEWMRWVSKLIHEELRRTPIIRSPEFQVYTTTLNKALLTSPTARQPEPITRNEAIELSGESVAGDDSKLRQLVASAGFPPNLVPLVLARLTSEPLPTFQYDEAETRHAAQRAAASVRPELTRHQAGEILYRRGDVLSLEQYRDVRAESKNYYAKSSLAIWQQRFGVVGLIAIITLFLGSFAALAYPRIVRNPLRMAAVCALIVLMLAVTTFVTAYAPIFLLPAAIGPALFVAIIVLVAYDQRLALLLSGLYCMIVTLALEQSIGFFILLIAGSATAIAQLREVRHRNSLIRAATGTAAVLGAGTLLLGLVEVPLFVTGAVQQVLVMALSAVLTSYGVSFLILGILPSIEKLFDITTGMTLAELRDPKRPLLRQLQQRAPGTYNHSLQVANIAEAAAEAIGADGLLVYVGALYHDIGKINKPEYFVENQAGGISKHEKLSPAMSLLVILGHVKNGIELAREYGLPRQLQHFIESHHGTTLVEYFYHAAKQKAETMDEQPIAEVEYRYPGPKPKTKEAAILMLSDAVESSTRAMTEPNPARIERLVRDLSARRLQDNQFDQCDLTFKELAQIEDAIIGRMMAIYHSRISYPSTWGAGGGVGSGKSTGGGTGDTPETARPPQARPASA